jgi:hypothetical protein
MAPWYGVGQDTAEESSNAHVLPTTPTPTPTPGPAPAAGESAVQADCPERPLFRIRNRTQSNKIAKKKYSDTLVKQYYRRYEMDWLKLREWLVDKFPDVEFRERYVRQKLLIKFLH